MLILFNNRFVKPSKAKVPITGSVGRGYGIFETLRTFSKKVFLEKEHLNRLFNSAERINLKIEYSKKEISKMLEKITKKSPFKNQRIKIMALEEGLFIISVPLKIDQQIYKNGVSIKSVVTSRGLPEIKSISYLPSFLSHEQAVKEGYFEALLIDKKGEVFEGAYHNLFWFENDLLCTRKEDVLPGTVANLISKLPFKLKYKKINLRKLYRTKEIFLTNSLNIVVPIIKIDKQKIGNGKPGARTKIILDAIHPNFHQADKGKRAQQQHK